MANTRKNRKGITIYHCIDANIGDGYNPLIFNHFIGNKHPTYKDIANLPVFSENPHIIGIGSIIKWNKEVDASNQIIVGSGFISEKNRPYAHQPLKIISVRGPKTRAKYLENGFKCPAIYGDLGLLTRYVIPSPIACNKKYNDKNDPLILKAAENPDWTVINIRQAYTPKRFVKQIHECEYILSSSLHGIIISDSYGIPAYHIEISDKVFGGQWKFKDYYESIKRPYGTIDIKSMNEDKIIKQLKPYKIHFDFDGYYQYIKDELNKVA